ncbi:MAG: hypothetical protein AAFZ17_03150 [Cyanobacteria bacterium J06650_10]
MESAYRTGRGSTTFWQRTEDLEARHQEKAVFQEQAKQTLETVVGLAREETLLSRE